MLEVLVNKVECFKIGGLLHPHKIPKGKWESISMGFIVGLPNISYGHDTIRVVVDRLTKRAQLFRPRPL